MKKIPELRPKIPEELRRKFVDAEQREEEEVQTISFNHNGRLQYLSARHFNQTTRKRFKEER